MAQMYNEIFGRPNVSKEFDEFMKKQFHSTLNNLFFVGHVGASDNFVYRCFKLLEAKKGSGQLTQASGVSRIQHLSTRFFNSQLDIPDLGFISRAISARNALLHSGGQVNKECLVVLEKNNSYSDYEEGDSILISDEHLEETENKFLDLAASITSQLLQKYSASSTDANFLKSFFVFYEMLPEKDKALFDVPLVRGADNKKS